MIELTFHTTHAAYGWYGTENAPHRHPRLATYRADREGIDGLPADHVAEQTCVLDTLWMGSSTASKPLRPEDRRYPTGNGIRNPPQYEGKFRRRAPGRYRADDHP